VEIGVLQKAVKAVMGTSGAKDGELWDYLCFRDGFLTSFNGVAGSVVPLEVPFTGCLNALKLSALIKDFDDDLWVDLEQHGDWVEIACDQMVAKLPMTQPWDFPELQPKAPEVVLRGVNIKDAIHDVLFCVSSAKDRPEFYAIGFRGAHVYGLDGRRLARSLIPGQVEKPFLISRDAAQQITRAGEPDLLWREGSRFGATYNESGLMVISSELATSMPFSAIDTCFAEKKTHVVPTPPGLENAVARVATMSDKDESRICLDCDGVTLTVQARAEYGDASETLIAPFETPFKIWVKAQSLAACFRSFKPTRMDFSDVIEGAGRMLRFYNDRAEHCMALMHGA